MKVKTILSMMLCACTALYTVGCSSDEGMDGKEDGNGRSTTGQAVTFTNKAETATTRTAISYTKGNAANVLWSAGDKIWVEDNTNNFVQSLAGVFSADMKVGKFSVTGTFPATTQVHYTGGASGTTVTLMLFEPLALGVADRPEADREKSPAISLSAMTVTS